jgi:hypothetical protein
MVKVRVTQHIAGDLEAVFALISDHEIFLGRFPGMRVPHSIPHTRTREEYYIAPIVSLILASMQCSLSICHQLGLDLASVFMSGYTFS